MGPGERGLPKVHRAKVESPGGVCGAPETVFARRERLQPGHRSPPATPGEQGVVGGSHQAERKPTRHLGAQVPGVMLPLPWWPSQ